MAAQQMATQTSMIGQIFHDIDHVLRKPQEFFRQEPHSVRWNIIYLATFMTFQTSLSTIFATRFYQSWSDLSVRLTGKVLPELQFTTQGYAALFATAALVTFVFIIVLMIASHLYLRYIGGSKTSFADTSEILAYGFTPNFLLGWIPYVSLMSSVWSLGIVIYGFRVKHPMPLWRFLVIILVIILALASAVLYILGY